MAAIVRRNVLRGIAAAAVASYATSSGMAWAQAVKWSTGTEKPRSPAPVNAIDCHHHIYDKQFPSAPEARFTPGDASVADYRMLQARIGTARNVVVQPSTYGTDNRLLVKSLAQFGAKARGVAVVNTSVTDDELRALHHAGVRGLRFNLAQPGSTTTDMLEPLSKRIETMGWHLQIHMTADQITGAKDLLARLPTQIVFDHLGRIPEPDGTKHPAFGVICGLMDKGKTWLKMSGAYLDTKLGPPAYADVSNVARTFVAAAPERMVWGSDWPHPTAKGEKPDDAVLFDLLTSWVPDEEKRKRVLVGNPEELYGFPAA